jgi:hypothetical protein
MALKAADLLNRLGGKAQQVGILEDRFTIDGVELVVRNLTPDEHDQVTREANEVEEDQYMLAVQQGQLARAIIEVDGVDLRDSAVIETGTKVVDGKTIHVHIERHAWLRENLLKGWGREAVFTAWRKLAELFVKAEQATVHGIKFDIVTETPEEKIRRLLAEASEASLELPSAMTENIWGDFGWMPKATPEELEAVAQRAREWQDKIEPPEQAPLVIPEPEEPQEEPPEPIPVPVPVPRPSPEALMAARQPLNQEAAQPIRPDAAPVARRSAYQADIEGLAALSTTMAAEGLGETPQTAFRLSNDSAELRRPQAPVADQVLVDAPPAVGINPRFKPSRR